MHAHRYFLDANSQEEGLEERLALTAERVARRFNVARTDEKLHSGLEQDDYVLPSGEIECVPESVDGIVEVNGWIVGTILFRIGPMRKAAVARNQAPFDFGWRRAG
jgi:hypothetical protein